MNDANHSPAGPVTPVGMDAYTRLLSLCIAEWRHGSDPRIVRNIPNVRLGSRWLGSRSQLDSLCHEPEGV